MLRSQPSLLVRLSTEIFCERAWTRAMSMLTGLVITPQSGPRRA
jgi:hypothetical protein